MIISVLTPDKEIFHGRITSVKVPGTLGEFQVLTRHAPIVSSLEAGRVQIVTAKGEYRVYDEETGVVSTKDEPGKTVTFYIQKGFIEVLKDDISLLVIGATFRNNNHNNHIGI
jgi:F-type H+-transporting ATPase subunit epsilon